jgi:signal transduction protein with GAF and PtsI domain
MPSLIRREVLAALADAEARGDTGVRVTVGLRAGGSMDAVKEALGRSGVTSYRREAESFLAVELSREQVLRVGKLKEHVSSIWLDQPVSAAL